MTALLSTEVEIMAARRSFTEAQRMLGGSPIAPAQTLTVGWHDSSVDPESGSFALVDVTAGLDDLIGEIVRVSYGQRVVFAYVLKAASLTVAFSLTRRTYAGLARLSIETIVGKVEVVD